MSKREKKQATLVDALIPIVCLALFLGIPIFRYGASPHVPLIGGTIIAGLVAVYRLGFDWIELE